MNFPRMITAFGIYCIAIYHYKIGFLRSRYLIDPYFNRPSLERYKDKAKSIESGNAYPREIHSSSSDPNISSRLKRR